MMWQAILIPLLLIGTALNPLWILGRLLETAVFRWIGRISYGLYLWQQMFLVPAELPRPLGFLQLFPFNVVAVFIVAATSYYFFEKHMMRCGHRLASKAPEDQRGSQDSVPALHVTAAEALADGNN